LIFNDGVGYFFAFPNETLGCSILIYARLFCEVKTPYKHNMRRSQKLKKDWLSMFCKQTAR